MFKNKAIAQYLITISLLIKVSFALATIKPPIDNIKVKVFSNTAIVSLYDFSYKNYLSRQKQTARFFTSKGWFALTKALIASNLNTNVAKNKYTVTSVATAPPTIKNQGLKQGLYHWQVIMPVMIIYKNPEYQQVQYLNVTLNLIYQDKLLINELITRPGKAPPCETTSTTIKITPPKQ